MAMTSPRAAIPCCQGERTLDAAAGSAEVEMGSKDLVDPAPVGIDEPLRVLVVIVLAASEVSRLEGVSSSVLSASEVSVLDGASCVLVTSGVLVDGLDSGVLSVSGTAVVDGTEGSVGVGLSDGVVSSGGSGKTVAVGNVNVSDSAAVMLEMNSLFSEMMDSTAIDRGPRANADSVVSNRGSAHSKGASPELASWHVWPVRQHHVWSQTTGHRNDWRFSKMLAGMAGRAAKARETNVARAKVD